MPPATSHPLDLLAVYRDLTADERRAVDTHVAACAECRATLAAYHRQDSALRAIPRLRPSRSLAPGRPARGRFLSGLSSVFALAALAALAWFVVLQLQTPGAAAAEPGLTLPATTVRLPSPWLPALPWLSASLLLVGLLLVFSQRSVKAPILAASACALLLISFVPPLSILPNPAAIYWRLAGGYSYDPRLPFKNNFLVLGQPDRQLAPYLSGLIGAVGLSPLDPNQRLVSYQILRVGLHPAQNQIALVTTRFIYEDGTSRVYPVPLVHPLVAQDGFLLSSWQLDGLERLRSRHLAFSGQPFATPDSPIRLGPARRLELNPAASRLDEADPTHWLWNSVRLQHLVWSPDGKAFLCAIEIDANRRQLWWVPLDGSPPVAVGPVGDVREYGFSSDGQTVVYTQIDPAAQAANPTTPYTILAVDLSRKPAPRTLATALITDRLPGLSPQGAWFFTVDGAMWIAPLDGGTPQRLLAQVNTAFAATQPTPTRDGLAVAYPCGRDLCLDDLQNGGHAQVPGVQPSDMTWSSDGLRLAVVVRDPDNLHPVELRIYDRQGNPVFAGEIAPRDVTDPPQWTPDGGAVFVQTYPQDGRRILAVDIASGQVLDLSQEHWDAYFALSPDGRTLLLNNGRGGFWLADVLR